MRREKTMPTVALVASDAGDGGRAEFEAHISSQSLANIEIIYADDPRAALGGVKSEFVVFASTDDRYIDDYALEALAGTAAYENADIAGGVRAGGTAVAADFVFRTSWLRENACLLELRTTDEQAFIAAAIERTGKHCIEERPYTVKAPCTSEPSVTVVVPAFNAAQYLERCLQSLAVQTHRNLEIIVVDDGSTDATAEIADKWAQKDARFKAVHKANGGLSSARNAGMKIASGKYIGFVDADDYVDSPMFAELAEALETHPFCDLAKCGVAVEFTYKVPAAERKATQEYFTDTARGEVRPDCNVVNSTDSVAWNKLYRLDFLRDNGITFPEGAENEDEAFFFEVFCRCRNCFFLPGKHYHYLRNSAGIMARQTADAASGAVPDAAKIYEFVADLLLRENRRDLLGALYRKIAGFVQRFAGTPVEEAICDRIAGILHKTNVFYHADLVCGSHRQWVQRRIFEMANRGKPRGQPRFDIPEAWYPSVPRKEISCKRPAISFVIPVYNVEKYIAATLESLRRQTMPYFEAICIDDGSIDDSGKILDFYANIDPRIRVWHVENSGVSAARNFGIEKARGRYVAFIDGDDRLHTRMAAETLLAAVHEDLDAVMFDFRCFANDTLNDVDHYWRIVHHAGAFPLGKTFSPAELKSLPVNGSCWLFLCKRAFLTECGVRFPGIGLGEDAVWVYRVLSKVRKMRIVNKPFYEYRRCNPSSAVSRLQKKESDAPILMLEALAKVYAETPDRRLRETLLNRIASDILFYGERHRKARAWLADGGLDSFGGVANLKRVSPEQSKRIDALVEPLRTNQTENHAVDIEYFIAQTPRRVQKIMHEAIARRNGVKKDLIVVAGQLDSTTNEPIDSWTFFRWLQDHGVPSRYVAWKKHSMLGRMRADNGLKDVILLSGNGVDDYEFIKKCRDLLPRLKAIVMENTALNPLTWRYFHMLDDCSYVFLQHGVMFWKMAPKLASSFAVANYVNVASEEEKSFLERHVPEHWETGRKPRYIIAGLPRWDLLKDESAPEREKIVFYMPTWRATFNKGMDAIAKSAYLFGMHALTSAANLEKLAKKHVRLVVAAHHHLANHVKGLDFALPVELVPTTDVSKWIRRASLCVTDYSSVSFDFLFLKKPCIFWTPDRYDGLLSGDDYEETVFAERQGAKLFNRVRSSEEVVALIEKYADSGFKLEEDKRAACERFFKYRTDICRHLYDGICATSGGEETK